MTKKVEAFPEFEGFYATRFHVRTRVCQGGCSTN
jgi:hypothetical protein